LWLAGSLGIIPLVVSRAAKGDYVSLERASSRDLDIGSERGANRGERRRARPLEH
jgi:hypothetical protein